MGPVASEVKRKVYDALVVGSGLNGLAAADSRLALLEPIPLYPGERVPNIP